MSLWLIRDINSIRVKQTDNPRFAFKIYRFHLVSFAQQTNSVFESESY